jgi:hypothetical protein
MYFNPVVACFRILLPVAHDHHWADLRPDNLNSEKEFLGRTIFGSTQLARLLMARQLAGRCASANLPVSVNCFDCGQVRPAYSLLNRLVVGRSGQTAASRVNIVQTAVHLAAAKQMEGGGQSGLYFSRCQGKGAPTAITKLKVCLQHRDKHR